MVVARQRLSHSSPVIRMPGRHEARLRRERQLMQHRRTGSRNGQRLFFFADPGDFNQFMPRVWGPERSHKLMEEAFAGYSIVTSCEIQGVGARAIDHLAFAGNLHVTRVSGRPAAQGDGRKRSDHFGVIVDCPAPLSGGGRKNAQRLLEQFGIQRRFTFSLIVHLALKREPTQILQGSEF